MPEHRDRAQEDPSSREMPAAEWTFGSRHFLVLRRLGSGGFGVVYLARDLATGTDIAVKTIPTARADLVYRLKREFRALADLRHQNLVSFYELLVEDDRVVLTMEYVPGDDFLTHVRRPGLDESRLRRSLRGLATGLAALHAAGKLHRDVKPSNVLVTPEGRVVLLDFGLATDVIESDLGRSIELAGTPEYMSPEHARNGALSPASDWWSVGVLLHQALTGNVPFKRSLPDETFAECRDEQAFLRTRLRDAPADLAALCASLLNYEPSRRAGSEEVLAVVGRELAEVPEPEGRLSEPPFLGRDRELSDLRQGLERVKSGEPTTVLVDGLSGAGKTSLVRRFLADLERLHDPIVLRGRCYERETVPYAGFDSLTDDLCRFLHAVDAPDLRTLLPRNVGALVRVFSIFERIPEIARQAESSQVASSDRQEIRRQAFGAFRELLARIADRRLLILHLDDLQWGDRDTSALIREIVRPPDAPPLLLILGFRTEERQRSPCLQGLLESQALPTPLEINLGPLSEHDSQVLVAKLLAGSGRQIDAARLARDSEGNPFLIHELSRFLTTSTAAVISEAPLDLRLALQARFERLPTTARRLLETVAVAGHPVSELVAWRAAGQVGSPAGDSALLTTQNLLRTSLANGERQLEPFHDRIRETITAHLPPERSRECHRGLVEALEDAESADPEVLAWHHLAAGNQATALEFLVRAASQAHRLLAFDRSARLLQHAVQLLPSGDSRRIGLLTSLGDALSNAGRSDEAARTFLAAADESGSANSSPLRRRAAEQFMFGGRVDEAKRLVRADLRAGGFTLPNGPRRALLSVLLRQVYLRLRGLDPAPARSVEPGRLALLTHVQRVAMGLALIEPPTGAELGTRFALEALRSGDPQMAALGTVQLAGHCMPWPRSRRADFLFRLARKRVEALGDRNLLALMNWVDAMREWAGTNWEGVVRGFTATESVLREEAPDRNWELWTARSLVVRSLCLLGRWDEARRQVLNGLAHARECGHLYGMATMCANFGMIAWLGRGEVEAARRNLREAAAGWTVPGLQQFWFLAGETLIDLYEDNGEVAWERLQRNSSDIRRTLFVVYPVSRFTAHLVCGSAAVAAAGSVKSSRSRSECLREAEHHARKLRAGPSPQVRAVAPLIEAGIAGQRGKFGEAAQHLESGARALDAVNMRPHADAARRHLARLRGEPLPEFLAGEQVFDPDAVAHMLVPGFRV